jgi:hypothetical protein
MLAAPGAEQKKKKKKLKSKEDKRGTDENVKVRGALSLIFDAGTIQSPIPLSPLSA